MQRNKPQIILLRESNLNSRCTQPRDTPKLAGVVPNVAHSQSSAGSSNENSAIHVPTTLCQKPLQHCDQTTFGGSYYDPKDSVRFQDLENEVNDLRNQNESFRAEIAEMKSVNAQLLRTCQTLRSSQILR